MRSLAVSLVLFYGPDSWGESDSLDPLDGFDSAIWSAPSEEIHASDLSGAVEGSDHSPLHEIRKEENEEVAVK